MTVSQPPFHDRAQAGFGILETLTGLLVFVILAVAGTKAFKGVMTNQKETAQVRALTDAVTVTAERLSVNSVAALTEAGSKYLSWSEPEIIGSGTYYFRYRTFPRPTIAGSEDSSVVGLEVETGTKSGGSFVANRSFATLIAPHLYSKGVGGQVSNKDEHAAEAAFYSSLSLRIAATNKAAKDVNQVRLNSFNCYDTDQCCGFMQKFFADPSINPTDGMDEKCHYRCALGGAVPMKEWQKSCSMDFCSLAPWKTKEQCCAAINSGECKSGSACAQACIDCVGENGSGCTEGNECKDVFFNDIVNCADGTFCDGSAIPAGTVAGLGDVKTECKTGVCGKAQAECQYKVGSCCLEYWGHINTGTAINPRMEICKTISSQEDCCGYETRARDWTLYCSSEGKVISARNEIDKKWYCGWENNPGFNAMCSHSIGCTSTFKPDGAPTGSCDSWAGIPLNSPWDESYPDLTKPPVSIDPGATGTKPGTGTPVIENNSAPVIRTPTTRGGSQWGSGGGRE